MHLLRQILPYPDTKQLKEPSDIHSFLAKQDISFQRDIDERIDDNEYLKQARDTFHNWFSLFHIHPVHKELAHVASSSSSSSHSSKRNPTKASAIDLPPFAKNVWVARLNEAYTRAEAWVCHRPTKMSDRLHCDAVSVLRVHHYCLSAVATSAAVTQEGSPILLYALPCCRLAG